MFVLMSINIILRKRNCIINVEIKRSTVVEVIREFKGLSEKVLEEACVFTLDLVNNHVSNPGLPKAD